MCVAIGSRLLFEQSYRVKVLEAPTDYLVPWVKIRNFWLIQRAFFDKLLETRGKLPYRVLFLYEPEICLSQIPFFEEKL